MRKKGGRKGVRISHWASKIVCSQNCFQHQNPKVRMTFLLPLFCLFQSDRQKGRPFIIKCEPVGSDVVRKVAHEEAMFL